jgi:DNA ligase-1
MTVIDILESLESNNSRIFKEELLDTHSNNQLLQRIFVSVGDPYTNFFVNKFKMPSSCGVGDDDDEVIDSFLDFVNHSLAQRNITGNAAKDAVVSFFARLTANQQKWCLRILLKNLRCGVQSTTVNKIWPNSIVGFSVQLAESLQTRFDPNSGIIINDSISYPVRVEPKLDGLRCIIVKKDGLATMFTRSGTVLETLPKIKKVIEDAPWDNFVLDGEAMGSDWNESASVVMSHKRGKDDSNIVFHVFDSMPFSDWHDQESSMELLTRVELTEELVSQVNNSSVAHVKGITVNDSGELLDFYSKNLEGGFEGIMIKDLSALYSFKRSNSVKKMKPIATYEGMIVGHYMGNRGSKREGLWGGFEVMMPNGIITRVGGGFTDALKAEIGMDPDSWIGKVVELEGQPEPSTSNGLTKDGKVRFPVFIRERSIDDVDPKIAEIGQKFLNIV